jgi:quercetin 2,3-dioxygenase
MPAVTVENPLVLPRVETPDPTTAKARPVLQVVTAPEGYEGEGFPVRRAFAKINTKYLDPFIMMDQMGEVEYAAGEPKGTPWHPHRGFETVTYLLDGEFEHQDSAGHRGLIRAGDVQWMTAGAGVIHSEEPSARVREQGGRLHGFQIWVNLPRRLKLTRPRYQEVPAERIPEAASPDGLARVRVIAGEALGAKALIETHTPIVFQDWSLQPGADVSVPVDPGQRVVLYVFEGEARVGDRHLERGQLAILGHGEAVRLRGGERPGRMLLLAGVPLREPIARYGPFVMNTRLELEQAFDDYRSGRMGEITRTAEVLQP